MTYRVVVYEFAEPEDKKCQTIGFGMSENKAERVQRGVLINLDTEFFYVAIEKETEPTK